MKRRFAAIPFLLALLVYSQPTARERPGPLAGGGFLLHSGWRLQPAGKQVGLDTFPISSALSSDGKYLLVLNAGHNPPSISVLDLAAAAEVSRAPVADGWLGLVFAPRGNLVYVGGGSQAAVFEFSFAAGKLAPTRTFPVVEADKRTARDFIGDVTLSPDGRLLYAADLYRDSVVVINPQSGRVIDRFKTGRRPYRILFHPDGGSYFVSSWADGSVYRHETGNGNLLGRLRLGPHPTDMVWSAGKPKPAMEGETIPYVARIFVTTSNNNDVHVLGITESGDAQPAGVIDISLTPGQPAGMTPSALALGAGGNLLFAACSDANAVAVVDVSESLSRLIGFIPSGWYPAAVRSLADGRLVVLNGRGMGPRPAGTASFIDAFGDEQLENYTKIVRENSPYRDGELDDGGAGANHPIPRRPGGPTPIEHVVYVVKQGHAYDQILGDLSEGNGDPSLARFGQRVTPNQHRLAREFVLFDNFYANGDSSADGLNWSLAAIASAYVQRLWPNAYARGGAQDSFLGAEPASVPPAGYLWTNAVAAGLSVRNYGFAAQDPALKPFTNRDYRSPDPSYSDVERAKVFLRELAEFEKAGRMPRLLLVRLGDTDAAGGDRALGMIAAGVSRSRFWPKTAIFVLQDSAAGPDHVDSHRSPAFVISPYVKRRFVDSAMYSTTSMLRTIELVLGLRPMTTFDAAARPMSAPFQATPDFTPYEEAAGGASR